MMLASVALQTRVQVPIDMLGLRRLGRDSGLPQIREELLGVIEMMRDGWAAKPGLEKMFLEPRQEQGLSRSLHGSLWRNRTFNRVNPLRVDCASGKFRSREQIITSCA
jgi:hypothetical protein